jgi:hypothetical protein
MSDQPLSEAAERVLGDARAEAERLGHEFIGSEHLLLGLLRSSDLAQSSLDAAGIDRSALVFLLESGQKRVRVRSDRCRRCTLSSHARRLLEAGAAGEGPLEAKVLLAALTDRRGALTRFLGEKGIPRVVIAEVAARAGVSAPVMPPPRERPSRQERPEGQQRQEKMPRQEQQEKQEKPARQEKTAREKQERPTRQERQEKLRQERLERQARPERQAGPERGGDRAAPEGVRHRSGSSRRSRSRNLLAEKSAASAVPATIVLNYMHASPILVFAAACLGVLPSRLHGRGDGADRGALRSRRRLLNATFGNAAELIIAIVALQAGLSTW